MWFTEKGKSKIGRITMSGTVTEYPIPTAASNPRGITGGPDGNVWFTEESGSKIGRITTPDDRPRYTDAGRIEVPARGTTSGPATPTRRRSRPQGSRGR